MELNCDEDAINMFTVYGQDSGGNGKSKTQRQRDLKLNLGDGVELSGTYTYRHGVMHTHFRFSSTREDVLKLLKLFDFSVSRMMIRRE